MSSQSPPDDTLPLELAKERWDAPVISLMRAAACALMEGVKKVENRGIRLKNNDYNRIGLPIGIHVKQQGKSAVVRNFSGKSNKFRTGLFTSGTHRGMDENTFYRATQNMN